MTDIKPTLERRLSATSAAMFGLSYMSPMVVIATLGAIAVKTGGAVALAYVIATAAMLLTAASYGYTAAPAITNGRVVVSLKNGRVETSGPTSGVARANLMQR